VSGKKVLEIGCGSGHSLKYHGDHNASELWGLDMSTQQIENATRYLKDCGYEAHLFNSPMEENPGLPKGYFDIVYSIYAIGWTTDLQKTFNLIASYLKKGGIFIFSWDHPVMRCMEIIL
jgi:ubiquinone/menaquinone biosynthesis C-methylase UbiE